MGPTPTPTIPTSRMRNLSLNMVRPRTDSFTRNVPPPRRASDGAVLALPIVPPNEKDSKRMSTFEYHRYQQELINAQYQRHGVNPLPVSDEQPIESPNPGRPSSLTLIQVSQEYKNNISTMVEAVNAQPNNPRRLNELNENAQIRSKRLSYIDGGRRMNLSENNPSSSGRLSENSLYYGEHRRSNTETTITQQQLYLPRTSQPRNNSNSTIVNLPSKFQHSVTSLSSGSTNLSSSGGSGGPPTPKNKRSSSITIIGEGGVGYTVERKEKEKRKKGILRSK
ncbi:9048_t:CDS:2 [Diversispora eburnea]|uniref:9048_t:CDS:1 n=1 Tax=Diversispora eburnea TaxID=1213867 RepID=A0A9N9A4H6_9GLOM|nr:9048_t:CDS:2 [Diversispora eburnea]